MKKSVSRPSPQTQRQTAATGNERLEFPDGDVQLPDGVNASEIEEPTDEPASDFLGTELPLLSQRDNAV